MILLNYIYKYSFRQEERYHWEFVRLSSPSSELHTHNLLFFGKNPGFYEALNGIINGKYLDIVCRIFNHYCKVVVVMVAVMMTI